ncbi:uncharacterized protein LOC123213259 isoform X1 [Mangifera indica]|uniref:uncharacterized protein LOC123213259 isoform X1 n=1 Tax=Mangifera indica TaxID=29780 RepID=UPI001CFA5F6F|nr:uncharacterized protein LOC123213259 isoform X1 [Mangifera indica]
MSEKGHPLPKFGEWDVNDPASAEGFTVIFNKARDEKKTGGKPESPKKVDPPIKHGVDPGKPQPVKKMVLLHPKPGCRILMRFCSSKSFHGRVCSCVTSPTVYLKKYRSFSAVACPAGICFCAVIFELLWGKAEKKGKNENLLYLYVLILWVIIRSQAIFLSLPSLLYYGL